MSNMIRLQRQRCNLAIELLEGRSLLAGDGLHHDHANEAPFHLPPQYHLVSQGGFLTGPNSGAPLDIALAFLNDRADDLGLTPEDFADVKVTSGYVDEGTGIAHIYLRQTAGGLEVSQADINVSISALGEVISVGGGFIQGLGELVNNGTIPLKPAIQADEAVEKAAEILGLSSRDHQPMVTNSSADGNFHIIAAPGVSLDHISAKLQFVPVEDNSVALSWELIVRTPDNRHWYELSVDGTTGAITSQADWFSHASYTALPIPTESPDDGPFQVIVDPQLAAPNASPFGWHDTNGVAGAESTLTIGNNVDAHLDRDGNNVADTGSRPDGGASLNFNAVFNPALSPLANANPAVTNLFYWNNVLHDVHYQYGFTPSAGNFQTNNYGLGGLGNDAVQADAQDNADNGSTNNANFGTPPDGSAPRMQMFEFTSTNPRRDSDMDVGIVVHEYGHGVSNRLTGGPANSSALNATQSGGMGEGWSDWWSLMFGQNTANDTVNAKGVGTYVLGQGLNGAGIRNYRYDFDIANQTLETFLNYGVGTGQSTQVHATGTRWASTLWDLNHLLIQKYGYEPNIYNGTSLAGNTRALHLVMNGLKLQPANPSFVHARDAILAADTALYGSSNQCEIWTAFARRGLGQAAATVDSNSTTLTTSFVVPAGICGLQATTTNPAVGSSTPSPLLDFSVNFSNAVDPATVGASDLQVNGLSANSVVLSNANQTATFSYNVSPIVAQGSQTLSIAANTIARASDADGIDSFIGTFRYDTLPLGVTTTVPAVGGTLNLPGVLDIDFNEPINPSSISTDDLTLSIGTVTSAVALDADSARYTISGGAVDSPMTVTLIAGKVTDTFGNPNPVDFVGNYFGDISTVAYPLPLASKSPLGSLVYDPTVSGVIGAISDTDNYTISVDPGQKITVYLDPSATLKGLIRLYDSSNNLLGSATNTVGLDAVIQTVSTIAVTDTYRIEVSSDGGATTGTYTLGLILNAREEAESHNGPTNDTSATAENINGSFITLSSSASRGAVLGSATGSDFFQFDANAGDTVTLALQPLSTGTVNATLFDPAGVSITAAVGGPTNVGRILNSFVVPITGSYRVRVTAVTPGTNYNLVVLKNADFDKEANDSIATAQAIGAADGMLGYVEASEIRVAVLQSTVDPAYSTAVINQLNDDSHFNFTATGVTGTQIDSAVELAVYDAVMLADSGTLISPAMAAALKVWVQSGLGGIVASSWTSFNLKYNSTDPVAQADLDAILPLNMALEFTDEFAGSTVITNGAHPVTNGVTSFVSSGESLAGGADVGATVLAIDELNRPAIIVGNSGSGRGVYLRPAYMFGQPDTLTPNADRLLEQAIAWAALSATTRDASDWYSFSVNVGDSLTIQSTTPADGAGNYTNGLNPKLELYSPSGSLIGSGVVLADGRNEQILHTASAAGIYRARIAGEAGTVGEYFVSVNGNTGTELPLFHVTSTSPANGSSLLSQPAVFTVDFNDAHIAGTLQASDLKVNGINATSVTFVDGDTALFNLPAGLGSGTHTVTIAAGAILDVQNTPIQAYSGTFTIDVVAPRVIATSVVANSIIAPGALAYTVTFSEPMRVSNILSTGDFTLHGNIRQATNANYAPSSFSFNAAGTELTLNFANLPDDSYTLTLLAGTTGGTNFTDVAGNALDGEFTSTLPSGNGTAGGDFVNSFFMDRATESLTLIAENPLGSLNYERTLVRTIAFAGDIDEFTLNVDPNQTISVVVTPTTPLLVPRVELFSPSSVLLDTSSASAPSQAIGLHTQSTLTGGTYRIVVNGLAGSIGRYTIEVILNSAFEAEERIVNTNTNDTPGTAQNLDGSFISLDSTLTQFRRGAVTGTTDIAAVLLPNEIEPNNTQVTSNIAAANFTPYSNNLYHLGFSGDSSSITDLDFFNIGTLQIGDVLSVSVLGSPSFRGTNTDTFVRLYRGTPAAPILVASNDDGGLGLDALLYRVDILTTDTYFVQMDASVNARAGTYQFGVYLENFDTAPITGGTFALESEPNNTAATANNASTSWRSVQYRSQTLGEIVTSDIDFYRYQFSAGDLVTINVDSLSALDARVNLRNSAGTIIAREDGTSVGPGTDSPVYSFIIPSSGAYYAEVFAASGIGAYSLDVLLSTNSPISFPAIGVDYYAFTASAGQSVSLALTSLTTGNVDVQLIGTNGTSTLASGVAGATNLNEAISNFPIGTSGTYFARITGDLGIAYSLVVTQNTAFDSENNNTFQTAQSLFGTEGVLGHVRSSTVGASSFNFEDGNQGFTVDNGTTGLWHRTTHRGSEAGHSSVTSFHYGREAGTFSSGQRNTGSIVSPVINLPSTGPITFGFNYILQTETSTSFDTANVQISTDNFATFTTIASRASNLPVSAVWREFTTDLAAFAGQNVRIRWIFDTLDSVDNSYAGWYVDDVRVGVVGDDDWYSVTVPSVGAPLRFETRTPSDGTGEFLNTLNPRIELYRPDGTLLTSGTVLADGRNELIQVSAPVAGTYRVRVIAEGTTNGEYFLSSNGSVPPTAVESIIASGSNWNAAFIDTVDGGGLGAGNGLGYALVPGTIVPNAGIDRLYVQFNQPVVGFDASSVAILGVNVADYSGRMTVTYDSLNMRGVIDFSQSISNDNLRLGLSGSITDNTMNAFEGDFDASTGSILDFRFNVSIGDASNDGNVNGGDLPGFAAAFNSSIGSPRYNSRADWNADGSVNGGDMPLYALWFNRSPQAEPISLNFLPSELETATAESEDSDSTLAPVIEDVDAYFSQWDDEDETGG